jgi:hypothetical protein
LSSLSSSSSSYIKNWSSSSSSYIKNWSSSSSSSYQAPFSEFDYINMEDYIVITGYNGARTEVNIPPIIEGLPVEIIEEAAFAELTSITSIKIPNSVITIKAGAFYHCTSLISVIIESSVTSIDYYAFSDCNVLNSVYFYGNAPSFGGYIFEDTAPATVYYPTGNITWPSATLTAQGITQTPW